MPAFSKHRASYIVGALVSLVAILASVSALAAPAAVPIPVLPFQFGTGDNPEQVATTIEILLALTLLSLAPSILIMTTSFVRLVLVFSFLRQAIGTQSMPPNQIIIGISLFLTFFIMAPVGKQMNETAIQPYLSRQIDLSTAYTNGIKPLRSFMLKQTREKDLELFISLAKQTRPKNIDEVSMVSIVPAYLISELKTAFEIGFLLYMPFLVIDMVVASILMSMGMMMLPPVMISMPFKLILFVLVDGWNLLVGSLVNSFK